MNPFLPQVTSQQPMAPTLMQAVPNAPQPSAVPTTVPPAVAAQHAGFPGWLQGLNPGGLQGLLQGLLARNPQFMANFAHAPWMGGQGMGGTGMGNHMGGPGMMTPGGGGGGAPPQPTGVMPIATQGHIPMPMVPGYGPNG